MHFSRLNLLSANKYFNAESVECFGYINKDVLKIGFYKFHHPEYESTRDKKY